MEEKRVQWAEIIMPLQNENARELWEKVRNFKDKDVNSLDSAPFFVIHLMGSLNSFQVPMPTEVVNDDADDCSQANTLAILPSYVGKTEAGTKILYFPFSRHLQGYIESPSYLGSTNNSYVAFDGFLKSET